MQDRSAARWRLIDPGEQSGRFWPRDTLARLPVLKWLMLQIGGFALPLRRAAA